MTKKNLIKSRMRELGINSDEQLALSIGMKTDTLRNKLNNKTEFVSKEISCISKALNFSPDEVVNIFLS